MNIDEAIYDLFSRTIYQILNKGQPLTYPQLAERIHESFREQHAKFDGSVEWYAVTVKHDMHARGIIEVFSQKGKSFTAFRNKEDLYLMPPNPSILNKFAALGQKYLIQSKNQKLWHLPFLHYRMHLMHWNHTLMRRPCRYIMTSTIRLT